MNNDFNDWELLKSIIFWISEYQSDRLLEESEWFGIQTNHDLLFADLIAYSPEYGLKLFLEKNNLGLTIDNVREFEKVSHALNNLEKLDDEWSERAYTIAVGMLKTLIEE